MADRRLSAEDCWPAARLGEAVDALIRALGWSARTARLISPENIEQMSTAEVGTWLAFAGDQLGVEITPQPMPYNTVESVLRQGGPLVLRVYGDDANSYLAVVRCRDAEVAIVTPHHVVRVVPFGDVRDAFCRGVEAPYIAEIDALLDRAGVAPRARSGARGAILLGRLADEIVDGGWNVRMASGSPFREQLRNIGLGRRLGTVVALYVLQYVLGTAGTVLLGRGALAGVVDRGWMLGWALLLVTLVPLRGAARWLAGTLAVEIEVLLKRRLLAGVMRLDPDEIRHEGAGAFLGRVFESEALQTLAIGGGISALFGVLELALAAVVVSQGAGGLAHVALLLVALLVIAAGVYRQSRHAQQRTRERLGITHALIEQMVGHRTRLAQQQPGHWHDQEDAALTRYLTVARAQDQTVAYLSAMPRVWTFAAVLVLLPSLLALQGDITRLALALFGVLMVERALRVVVGGVAALVNAWASWDQVRLAFHAAARPVQLGSPDYVQRKATGVVLEARDLVFRHLNRGAPVLRGVSLRVEPGDRVLLQGPSGGGKSTLAAVLAGLRVPESGLLLADGLDPQTLGAEGWRRRVTIAPQFHENHIFSGSLAFNLFMGKRWPIARDDMRDAWRICRQLGLEVVYRMPNKMYQQLGETGWQLSHGERSRIFIARALLQGAEVVIFDESLGALDPERHALVLRTIGERARTLVLIAHP